MTARAAILAASIAGAALASTVTLVVTSDRASTGPRERLIAAGYPDEVVELVVDQCNSSPAEIRLTLDFSASLDNEAYVLTALAVACPDKLARAAP